ncbi:MAG TPA: hypothetical protein VNU93_08755 [Verrucomicrobiae bacterium]|nr:hypothetical protein [Verrucomicrobiae bacterium]
MIVSSVIFQVRTEFGADKTRLKYGVSKHAPVYELGKHPRVGIPKSGLR